MESDQAARPASPHLRAGLVTVGVAGAYVVGVLLFGWPEPFLLAPVVLLSLLFGGIAVLAGLVLKANRRRPRLWMHIGVFLANVVLLYILSIGPGNYLPLIDLRTRLAVALTGGQGCKPGPLSYSPSPEMRWRRMGEAGESQSSIGLTKFTVCDLAVFSLPLSLRTGDGQSA
jgi:hypothetical protein